MTNRDVEKEFYDPLMTNPQLWRSLDVGDMIFLFDNVRNKESCTVYIVIDNSFQDSIQMKLYSLEYQKIVKFNPGFRTGDKIARINESKNWEIGPSKYEKYEVV